MCIIRVCVYSLTFQGLCIFLDSLREHTHTLKKIITCSVQVYWFNTQKSTNNMNRILKFH